MNVKVKSKWYSQHSNLLINHWVSSLLRFWGVLVLLVQCHASIAEEPGELTHRLWEDQPGGGFDGVRAQRLELAVSGDHVGLGLDLGHHVDHYGVQCCHGALLDREARSISLEDGVDAAPEVDALLLVLDAGQPTPLSRSSLWLWWSPSLSWHVEVAIRIKVYNLNLG